jgi:multidrug resistance efflux pump
MFKTSHRSIIHLLLIAALFSGMCLSLPGWPLTILAVAANGPGLQQDSSSLELKCKLEPRTWVSAGFAIPGRIEHLLVETGDIVQAGQQLAELSNLQKYQAAIATADLNVILAKNSLDTLQEQADYQLALAEQTQAQANKAVEDATWQLASIKHPFSQQAIDQAFANQILAEKKLDQLRKDLEKVEKQLNDKRNGIWRFVKSRLVKQQILFLQREVALAESHYQDAVQKYKDRLKPPDPIDVAQAEAKLAAAQAQAEKAQLDRERLANGPDPDELARLEAQMQSAEAELNAARSALADADLTAPIMGRVAAVQVKAGEWTLPGQSVLVIADLEHWIVQCDELTQQEIIAIQPGESVQIRLDALPDLDLMGTVATIGDTYQEIRDEARFYAKIDLIGDDPGLRWGMTARVIPVPGTQ